MNSFRLLVGTPKFCLPRNAYAACAPPPGRPSTTWTATCSTETAPAAFSQTDLVVHGTRCFAHGVDVFISNKLFRVDAYPSHTRTHVCFHKLVFFNNRGLRLTNIAIVCGGGGASPYLRVDISKHVIRYVLTNSPPSSNEAPLPRVRHRPHLPPSSRRRCLPPPLVPPDSPFPPSAGRKETPEMCTVVGRGFPHSNGGVRNSLV